MSRGTGTALTGCNLGIVSARLCYLGRQCAQGARPCLS